VADYRLVNGKLIACCGLLRQFSDNIDLLLTIAAPHPLEDNIAFSNREDRMVLTNPDVLARMELCAALANDDIARDDVFPTKTLYTQSFSLAVATILR